MDTEPEAIAKLGRDRWVDNRTYVDPAVYELELERIFDRVWVMVAHESEVANAGDYITTSVAENPILVSRDRSGTVRAFHNVCRHRGARVVNDDAGHCSTFRCPYHFWTYSLEGDLLGVAGEEAYDGSGFQKDDFPLVEASCEVVLGLVFVNLQSSPEQSLQEFLGPEIIEALNTPLAAGTYEVFKRASTRHELNWKIFAENARDGYHVPFVHPFFRQASPPGEYQLFRNSHAIQYLGMGFEDMDQDLVDQLRLAPLPGVEVGYGYVINIFPDTVITLRSNVVSLDFQVLNGPTSITMENRTLGLVGDDEETRKIRDFSQKTWFQNPVELEDVPVFHAQQAGVRSRRVRYSVLARGADAMTGLRGDDNRLRHFWDSWRRLMGVEENSASRLLGDS